MRIIRVYVFILSYFICIQSLLAIENNYFINPQLIRLLLDPGLLTPWKIAEIDSIINLELDEIKQIYKTAEANSNIYTSNYSLNLVFNYADTIVNSIDKTITSLNESRLIDSNNMTEIFIIGGSLEGLYQYLKFKEKNNRPKVHWNFLPISRLGFSELDPKGFRDYMRKRFFNLLKENKNIIFFDTYCNGETLGFVSTVISKIILEMRKSSSFPLSKVALIGMTEYNGELRKKENSFEQFNLYQNKFYSSNSSKLPILKISGNKQSLSTIANLPKSQIGKYSSIGDDGLPRTDLDYVDAINELNMILKSSNHSDYFISRRLSVYLERRLESVIFYKRFYAPPENEELKIQCEKLLK